MSTTKSRISPNIRGMLDVFEKDVERVDLLLELAAYKRKTQLYEKRRNIIKSIPKFWPITLQNNDDISVELQNEEDIKALDSLTDVWVSRDPIEPRAYTIEFTFAKNPYFEDRVLKKIFRYLEPKSRKDEKMDAEGFKWKMLDFDWESDVKPQAIKIQWKKGKNLCRKYPQVGNDPENPDDLGSFFNWFEKPCDAFDIGVTIAEDIFPDAVAYFVNEKDSDDDDDNDNNDDDDEDEDENDDDDE